MGKKEEWEEIEKFERKEEQKKLEEYRGVDVTKEYEEILNKPKNNVRKRIILNIAKSILKISNNVTNSNAGTNTHQSKTSLRAFFIIPMPAEVISIAMPTFMPSKAYCTGVNAMNSS